MQILIIKNLIQKFKNSVKVRKRKKKKRTILLDSMKLGGLKIEANLRHNINFPPSHHSKGQMCKHFTV